MGTTRSTRGWPYRREHRLSSSYHATLLHARTCCFAWGARQVVTGPLIAARYLSRPPPRSTCRRLPVQHARRRGVQGTGAQERLHFLYVGHAYHFVDLERGVRRNGQRIASDLHEHTATIRTMAPQAQLSETCLEPIAKANVWCPQCKRPSRSSRGMCGSRCVNWTLAPPVSYAMHAHLIPRMTSIGWPRPGRCPRATAAALAERLRTPLFAPGGPWAR